MTVWDELISNSSLAAAILLVLYAVLKRIGIS